MKISPKVIRTLQDIRHEAKLTIPKALEDFDKMCRFILKSPKLNLEETFNVGPLATQISNIFQKQGPHKEGETDLPT